MSLSIISAVSGVGRGVKYLSNLNLVLSVILLLTFVIFGSFLFAMTTYGTAMVDYFLHYISLSFGAFCASVFSGICGPCQLRQRHSRMHFEQVRPMPGDRSKGSVRDWRATRQRCRRMCCRLYTQPVSPGVSSAGRLAGPPSTGHGGSHFRPSWDCSWHASPRRRSVREFIIGCVIAPALVCFAWMTILGGTAVDLELAGTAGGEIIGSSTRPSCS